MTPNADSVLAGALRRNLSDLLTWLSDYPGDQVAPDALASIRQSVDWVIAQLPASERERLALATAVGLVVDLVWWLDTCDDDEVEADVAAKAQEACAWFIDELPDGQRRRLIDVLEEQATAELDPGRRYWLRFFPFAVGILNEEPDASPGAREWVRPEDRPGRTYGTGRIEPPQQVFLRNRHR